MRLSSHQSAAISGCVHRVFGPGAQVVVYGSVLDDAARGGDVDLLVMTAEPPTRHQRALATLQLEGLLNRTVDLTAAQRDVPGSAWVRIVQGRAQPLDADSLHASTKSEALFETPSEFEGGFAALRSLLAGHVPARLAGVVVKEY